MFSVATCDCATFRVVDFILGTRAWRRASSWVAVLAFVPCVARNTQFCLQGMVPWRLYFSLFLPALRDHMATLFEAVCFLTKFCFVSIESPGAPCGGFGKNFFGPLARLYSYLATSRFNIITQLNYLRPSLGSFQARFLYFYYIIQHKTCARLSPQIYGKVCTWESDYDMENQWRAR